MSDEDRSREELLDNTPEAVAMRRAREKRLAEAARRTAEPAAPARPSRRRAVMVGALAALTGARVLERIVRGAGRR